MLYYELVYWVGVEYIHVMLYDRFCVYMDSSYIVYWQGYPAMPGMTNGETG